MNTKIEHTHGIVQLKESGLDRVLHLEAVKQALHVASTPQFKHSEAWILTDTAGNSSE